MPVYRFVRPARPARPPARFRGILAKIKLTVHCPLFSGANSVDFHHYGGETWRMATCGADNTIKVPPPPPAR